MLLFKDTLSTPAFSYNLFKQRSPMDRNGVSSDFDSLYPCRNAINPHMQELQTRVDTFLTWERSIIQAQPEELGEAGLFYIGEGDRVKCWYCNGGLQHWEYDDDPWFEHAKWYPLCEYLLQKKGA